MPQIVVNIIWAIVLGAATFVVGEIAARAFRKILKVTENPLPTSSLVINIVRGVIWAIGLSFILEECFDIDASAIFTALGIGGVALSLGLQDTLSNFIGGIQVTFMRIVEPGDNISVGGNSGVVQDITWRQTTIKDSTGQEIILPNSIVSSSSVTHLLPENRVVVPFSIPRDAMHRDAKAQDGNGMPADEDETEATEATADVGGDGEPAETPEAAGRAKTAAWDEGTAGAETSAEPDSHGGIASASDVGTEAEPLSDDASGIGSETQSDGTGAAGAEAGSPAASKSSSSLDELTDRLAEKALAAANSISKVTDGPTIRLSQITSLGIDGKIIFMVEDADKTSAAADAVVRAIAGELE